MGLGRELVNPYNVFIKWIELRLRLLNPLNLFGTFINLIMPTI